MAETRIDYGRMLDVFDVEVELIATVADSTPPDLPVPACPGLTAGETVRHLGSIYRMLSLWLAHGAKPQVWQRKPAPRQPVSDYLREAATALRTQLRARGPDEECETWYPPQSDYRFWARRMLHETVVHRGDVESAALVRLSEVDTDVAVDGVDEVLSLWFEYRLRELGLTGHRRSSVLLTTTDADACSWLARIDRSEVTVTTVDLAEADAAVLAEPVQLYRWLWGRVPTGQDYVAVSGDEDAVAQLWALLRLSTR
jgi:uncharacterized protein (TIGR03083 family)